MKLSDIFFWRNDTRKKTKKDFRKSLPELDNETRFSRIYEINYWGNTESRSGDGSTLKLTENLRKELPNLFDKFAINTVFDGPCGDFNWMRHVVADTGINYIGADIVPTLIKTNQEKYSDRNIRFLKLDLTKDPLPEADLMICRDCLFHLSYLDTLNLLKNFLASRIPYLLTTSYLNHDNFKNEDILSGHFRKIDLFSTPYCFPADSLYTIADYLPEESPRHLYLWNKSQLFKAVALLESHSLTADEL